MNSYEMYQSILEFIKENGYDKTEIVFKTRALIKCIAKELSKPPYLLRNSAFIREFQDKLPSENYTPVRMQTSYTYGPIIHIHTTEDAMIDIDAYAILSDTSKYISTKDLSKCLLCANYITRSQLFRGHKHNINPESVKKIIAEIQSWLDNLREKYTSPDNTQDLEEKISIVSQAPSVQENETSSSSVDFLKIEQEQTERAKLRLSENRQNIAKWHASQKIITEEIAKLQPDLSKLMKGFLTFSDTVVEDYVLQFAKMQIKLFNLITDDFQAHKDKSRQSGNSDYVKAVKNYEDFCDSITEDLSAFGIEEISTEEGVQFDGKIHEAVGNSNFKPSSAVIKKSVRTGFKYKDNVLQKEKVNVY